MNIDIFMIRSTCRFITHPTKLHRLDDGRGVAGTKQTTTEQTMPPSLCHRTASCPGAPLGSAGATGGGGSGTVEQRRRSVGLPWGRGPGRALHGWRGQRVAFPAGWQALWGGGVEGKSQDTGVLRYSSLRMGLCTELAESTISNCAPVGAGWLQ